MNRNRRSGGGDRDRGRRSFGGGGHDGLLGEGPGAGMGAGGMFEPMMNSQMNQLMLAQQLLQKQAVLNAGFGPGGGGDLSALAGAMNNMQMMQQRQQHAMGGGGFSGGAGGDFHHHHRKRVGGMQDRDMEMKRRRRDSFGRSGDHDRYHGRDNNRGNDGRDRVRSSRWEPVEDHKKKNIKKSNDDYDPAEPTEDEEGQDKESNLYCHVCSVSVYDEPSFKRHLNGSKHQARMNSVLSVHQMKSSQLQSRLKAEEHLRKIEGKAAGYDPDYFCKICNNDLTIPWERHRFSNIHKQRQLQVKRGCGWCGVHNFNNFTDVLEHRETEGHKTNAQQHGKKNDEPINNKHEKTRSADRRDRNKKEEEEEDLTIPEFDPENPVGCNYVVPVTGFFCKLCNKFYNNEKSAKVAHCQTEGHYEKFKAATEVKIAAREERKKKEEEEAAAAAEAARLEKDIKMEEDGEKEGAEEEAGEKEGGEKDGGEDGEDYDDALPMEDSDDEGGLVKLMVGDEDSKLEESSAVDDSMLNETSANGSFTFLTGDKAQAHLNQQAEAEKQTETAEGGEHEVKCEVEENPLAKLEGEADDKTEDTKGNDAAVELKEEENTLTAEALSQDNGVSLSLSQEDLSQDNGVSLSLSQEDISAGGVNQDDPQAVSTPVAEEQSPAPKLGRGRGTAKRGRGRGRAKK